ALIQLTLRERWPGIQNLYDDWANVAYYSVYLVCGFALACEPALEDRVDAEWRRGLRIGAAAPPLLLLAVPGLVRPSTVVLAGSAVAGWCFVVAFLGIARRWFVAGEPALAYLSESAFPVYVLHQAAIVVPGWFIVGLPAGVATKFALLLTVSVAFTMATYHWLVRPFAIPRLLLGMKPRACPVRVRALAPSAAASILVLLLASRAGATATPIGLWYAEGGAAKVAIASCDGALCGRV